MDAKLTLKLDKDVIETAKLYAKQQKTSLSNMVENYLSSFSSQTKEKEERIEITPLVKSLSGVLPNMSDEEFKEQYYKHLEQKHK